MKWHDVSRSSPGCLVQSSFNSKTPAGYYRYETADGHRIVVSADWRRVRLIACPQSAGTENHYRFKVITHEAHSISESNDKNRPRQLA